MFRNTVLYHRLWYIKRRNIKKTRVLIRLAAIFIILAVFANYADKRLSPYLEEISQLKAQTIVTDTVSKVVAETFSDYVTYDDIVVISRDRAGNITSIRTDVVKLNKLSAKISQDIGQRLSRLHKDKISIPLGTLLGIPILAASGPELHMDVMPYGSVEADFKSEFSSEGINQTRHTIYLLVKAKVSVTVPLFSKNTEVTAAIPVAETVIVGKVPGIYFKR